MYDDAAIALDSTDGDIPADSLDLLPTRHPRRDALIAGGVKEALKLSTSERLARIREAEARGSWGGGEDETEADRG